MLTQLGKLSSISVLTRGQSPRQRALAAAPVAGLLRRRCSRRVLIGATCVLVFIMHLGRPNLFDPDEGRHAEIARELLATGNWITPTLNLQPYADKPIFFYWLLAASLHLFGHSEWAVRLPSALAACAGVAATAWWGARFISPLVGGLAGLMLATAGMYIALGRFVVLDMVFASFLVGAFLYGSAWCLSGRARGRPVWPFYVFLALATLTKGPVALVLTLLIFWPFVHRVGLRPRDLHLRQGVLILALVAGSWFVLAAIVAPDYVTKFLWGHNVGRFVTRRFGHPMHPFAYLYILPLMFLPWSIYLPAAVLHARRRLAPAAAMAIEFCALSFAVTFVFFSLSAAKLPTYILPAFPSLCLLVATALARVVRRGVLESGEEQAHRSAFYVLAALVGAAPIAAYVFLAAFAPERVWTSLYALVGLPIVWVGWRWVRARRFDLALCSIFLLTVVTVVVFYARVMPALNDVYSLKYAAELVRLLPPSSRIVSANAKTSSLAFYLERPIETVATVEEAAAMLSGSAPTAVVTKRKLTDRLREHLHVPVYLWWRAPLTKALIVNRPPPPTAGIVATRLTPTRPRLARGRTQSQLRPSTCISPKAVEAVRIDATSRQ